MRVNIDKLTPKLREDIKNIASLDKDKVYILELSKNIPAPQWSELAKHIHKIVTSVGLTCIITPEGTLSNIYELTGGDDNDSRASTE